MTNDYIVWYTTKTTDIYTAQNKYTDKIKFEADLLKAGIIINIPKIINYTIPWIDWDIIQCMNGNIKTITTKYIHSPTTDFETKYRNTLNDWDQQNMQDKAKKK